MRRSHLVRLALKTLQVALLRGKADVVLFDLCVVVGFGSALCPFVATLCSRSALDRLGLFILCSLFETAPRRTVDNIAERRIRAAYAKRSLLVALEGELCSVVQTFYVVSNAVRC